MGHTPKDMVLFMPMASPSTVGGGGWGAVGLLSWAGLCVSRLAWPSAGVWVVLAIARVLGDVTCLCVCGRAIVPTLTGEPSESL